MKEFKTLVGEVELIYKKKEHNKVQIIKSSDAVEFFRKIWPDDIMIRESYVVLFLNRCNNVISYYVASMGGINGTVADIRMIAKAGIDCLASGAILCHNHPSGKKEPSESDKILTRKMIDGLDLISIIVLDNVIITDDDYYSFADEGEI